MKTKKKLSNKETAKLLEEIKDNMDKISKLFDRVFDKADQAACEKYNVSRTEWETFKERRLRRIKELQASGLTWPEASKICESIRP